MSKAISPIRKRTKRHKYSSFTYLDDECLQIRFYSLVIKVSSINEHYGLLKDFVRKHRLHGVTNGKLLIITEMIAPGSYLIDLGRQVLSPMGLKYTDDFIFLEE